MIRLLSIFTASFLCTIICFANTISHNLILVHNEGKEKKLDWKSKTFFISKKIDGFKHDAFKTWIALPPLLHLSPSGKSYKIVPNTKKEKSPFASHQEIKQVLLVEHFQKNLTLHLKKVGQQNKSRDLFLKITLVGYSGEVRISERCKNFGVNIDGQKNLGDLLSIDCQKKKRNLEISIISAQPTKNLLNIDKEINVTKQDENRLLISLNMSSSTTIGTFASEKYTAQMRRVAYTKQETKKSQFYSASHRKNGIQSLKRPNNQRKNETVKTFLFTTSLLGSKLGIETDFLSLYRPRNFDGHFAWHINFPVRMIASKNKAKTFFESGLSYNLPLSISRSSSISFGTGFKGTKFGESRIFNEVLLGPELRINFSTITYIYERFQYSSSLMFVPIYINPSAEGSKILWEIININLLEVSQSSMALSLRYSYINFKKNLQSFSDSKFLGGMAFIW